MNFSSAALAWTKSTSASPRRAVSSAWPVPWATTFTSGLLLEYRQQISEQAGILCRGRGGDDDGPFLRCRLADQCRHKAGSNHQRAHEVRDVGCSCTHIS